MKLQAADQTQTEHHPEQGCGLWSPAALSQSTDGSVWRIYLFIYSLDALDIILTSHQFHKTLPITKLHNRIIAQEIKFGQNISLISEEDSERTALVSNLYIPYS